MIFWLTIVAYDINSLFIGRNFLASMKKFNNGAKLFLISAAFILLLSSCIDTITKRNLIYKATYDFLQFQQIAIENGIDIEPRYSDTGFGKVLTGDFEDRSWDIVLKDSTSGELISRTVGFRCYGETEIQELDADWSEDGSSEYYYTCDGESIKWHIGDNASVSSFTYFFDFRSSELVFTSIYCDGECMENDTTQTDYIYEYDIRQLVDDEFVRTASTNDANFLLNLYEDFK